MAFAAHAEEPALAQPEGEAPSRPPFGLPPGWKVALKTYKSGASEGRSYQRFTRPDGQGNYSTVSACIRAHAAMNGNDPDEAVAEYNRLREELQGERSKAREQEHLRVEQAGEAFRARYGLLDGATLAEMPGWRVEAYFTANCGQTHKKLIDPTGQTWRLLKDAEAVLGKRLLDGGAEALDAEVAGARKKAEKAHGGAKRAGPTTNEVEERAKFLKAMARGASAAGASSAPAERAEGGEEETYAVTDEHAFADEDQQEAAARGSSPVVAREPSPVLDPDGDELLAMLDRGSKRAREAEAASSRSRAEAPSTAGPTEQEAVLAKMAALQAEMDRLREQLATLPPEPPTADGGRGREGH